MSGGMTPLEQVYRHDRLILLRAIRRKCRSWDEAEDALHEAIIRIYATQGRNVAGLIYTAAVNVALYGIRTHANRSRLLLKEIRKEEIDSPEEIIALCQISDIFQHALGQMVIEHEKLAEAFLMRAQLELPFEEISKRMGVGDRMVKIYVERAVEYLREYMHA